MAYDKMCCDCEFFDRNQKTSDWFSGKEKYKCKKDGDYYKLDNPSCYRFEKKKTDGYTPSGCFITTITCEVLGYEDNCELLTVLRNFRENYLKKDSKYLPLLLQYDQIGPIISNNIFAREDKYPLCLGLLIDYLIPCANLIKEGNFEFAVNIYVNMVTKLQEEFGIDWIKADLGADYDIETLGKGRSRSKNIASV